MKSRVAINAILDLFLYCTIFLQENRALSPKQVGKNCNDEKQHLLDSDYQSGETSSIHIEEEPAFYRSWEEPLIERKLEHPLSNLETLIHLLKGKFHCHSQNNFSISIFFSGITLIPN